MIKIKCDSVLYKDGDGRVELDARAKGPRDNIKFEIYTIFKWLEDNCTDPYLDAVRMLVSEVEDGPNGAKEVDE